MMGSISRILNERGIKYIENQEGKGVSKLSILNGRGIKYIEN